MESNKEKLARYLERIELPDDAARVREASTADVLLEPTLETLSRIAFHHAKTIPFENFNPATGNEVDVQFDGIYHKLVELHRGGYCFEMNSMMRFVLTELGFASQRYIARVLVEPTPTSKAHLVNVVTIDGKQYHVDVGFGGKTPRIPLLLEYDTVQIVGTEMYRFIEDLGEYTAPGGYRLQYYDWEDYGLDVHTGNLKDIHAYWRNQYAYSFAPIFDIDIYTANFYVNRSPSKKNIFTNSRMAAMLTNDGRKTIFHDFFTVYKRLSTVDFDAMKQQMGHVVELPFQQFEAGSTTTTNTEELIDQGYAVHGGIVAIKTTKVPREEFLEMLKRELRVDLAAEGMTMDSFLPQVMAAADERI